MAAGDFSVNYSTTTVTLNQFSGDDLPRAYLGQATLDFSAIGAGFSTGPSVRQKKIWSIAAYATYQQCLDTLSLFDAWDAVRAQGVNNAEVNVTDELFGTTQTATAFFTEPPTITNIGNGIVYLLTFVLTET